MQTLANLAAKTAPALKQFWQLDIQFLKALGAKLSFLLLATVFAASFSGYADASIQPASDNNENSYRFELDAERAIDDILTQIPISVAIDDQAPSAETLKQAEALQKLLNGELLSVENGSLIHLACKNAGCGGSNPCRGGASCR